LLTLLAVPVMYSLLDDFGRKFRRWSLEEQPEPSQVADEETLEPVAAS
jgi:hypothetical protein